MGARLVSLVVSGAASAWRDAGFVVAEGGAGGAGRIALANGAVDVVAGEPSDAVVTMVVDDVAGAAGPDGTVLVDGLRLRSSTPGEVAPASVLPEHPNGAFELDHVVVVTDSIERTSAVIAEVLGLEQRRVRDTGKVRQAFHRFADEPGGRGCIVELVERPEAAGAALWGFVVNVSDLDAAVDLLGPDRLGLPKPAVQPGREIATVRRSAHLGVPLALMSVTSA